MNRKPMDTSGKVQEEGDYVNAAVCTVDNTAAPSGQKFLSFSQSFSQMAACWLTLLVIMVLRIYFTSVMSENIAKLTAENQNLKTLMQYLNVPKDNLTNINHNLRSEYEILRRDNNNLTQAYNVLDRKIKNMTAENQDLETQNRKLTAENQNLKTQRDNLTGKIQDMETEWNELNVSRAQWSIDAYCRQNEGGQCQPCQEHWLHSLSSCCAINNPKGDGQKTWAEARENCKGKNSVLAVIVNEQEKTFIKDNSWDSSGNKGYWIGLRVEDGRWKWVDGSDLNETSWVPPPTNGHCAISVEKEGWKSVSCGDRNRWVCQQKALSV